MFTCLHHIVNALKQLIFTKETLFSKIKKLILQYMGTVKRDLEISLLSLLSLKEAKIRRLHKCVNTFTPTSHNHVLGGSKKYWSCKNES